MEKYEYLVLQHDPLYERIKFAIEIVKEFIRKRKLILYGGTAIDFALRLKGDQIYSDDTLSVPDLDFYSPQNVADAYDLAEILYEAGFESRAINALHAGTMRVDAGDNHFVADISYMPPAIFAKIPTLKYAGMKLVSPENIYIDLHNSLAHPFSNPPQEVIFERWGKDIKRFNKLFSYYPVKRTTSPAKTHKVILTDLTRADRLISGWAAWALYRGEFDLRTDATAGAGAVANEYVLNLMLPSPELVFVAENLPGEDYGEYRDFHPLLGIFPEARVFFDRREIWYSTDNQLVSYEEIELVPSKLTIKVVSPQYLAKYFIAKAIYHEPHDASDDAGDAKTLADLYRSAYIDILEIASRAPPTIRVFGKKNQSKTTGILMARAESAILSTPEPAMPKNYRPPAERPSFDPSDSPFYQLGGDLKTPSE